MSGSSVSVRIFILMIAAGFLVRLAALTAPGTGDVQAWKTWAYNAATGRVSQLYGVGATAGGDTEYRLLRFGDLESVVDYPPLVLYELGAAARPYGWLAGSIENGPAFTCFVKAVPVAFEAALTALLFVTLRRTGGDGVARWASAAYWLNPAAIVNASFGGYLDALFVLPAVAALVAAASGWSALAGGLIAAAMLTKPQGVFILPAVAIAVWNAGAADRRWARLTLAMAGAAVVTAAVVVPFVAAGAWWNMLHGIAAQANEPYVSAEGYNFWWIAGHALWVAYAWHRGLDAWNVFTAPVARVPFVRAAVHGLPWLRAAASVMALGGIAWGVWIGRRARDLSMAAAVGAFSVHAYAVLGAQVHENHVFAAVPLLVVAAASRKRFVPVFAGVSAFLALNMLFYMFSDEERTFVLSRSLTLLDTTLLLAVFNCALFVWHASVLRREALA